MNLSPEKRLIQLIADPDAPSGRAAFPQNASRTFPIGGEVIDLAVAQGLGGLLYKRLHRCGMLHRLSPDRREALKRVYYATIRNNLRLTRATTEILDHLNAAGLRVVLLQGMSLLTTLYPDPGLRALSDIDLWVLPEGFGRFAVGMQRLGYVQKPHHPMTFTRGPVIVDVHTHLFWADRIRARRWLLRLGQREIFDSAETAELEGRRVGVLSAPDQFIYLGAHAIKHRAARLVWLVDIRELVDRWTPADWRILGNRARQLGQDRGVNYLLKLLGDVFGYRPPGEGLACLPLPPLKSWERFFLRRAGRPAALSVLSPLVLLPSGISFPRKCVFFLENLFPDPGALRQVFAARAHLRDWQLYGLRVLQLLGLVKAG